MTEDLFYKDPPVFILERFFTFALNILLSKRVFHSLNTDYEIPVSITTASHRLRPCAALPPHPLQRSYVRTKNIPCPRNFILQSVRKKTGLIGERESQPYVPHSAERTNERTNKQANERGNERTSGRTGERANEPVTEEHDCTKDLHAAIRVYNKTFFLCLFSALFFL